jgi:hypothetical protein
MRRKAGPTGSKGSGTTRNRGTGSRFPTLVGEPEPGTGTGSGQREDDVTSGCQGCGGPTLPVPEVLPSILSCSCGAPATNGRACPVQPDAHPRQRVAAGRLSRGAWICCVWFGLRGVGRRSSRVRRFKHAFNSDEKSKIANVFAWAHLNS